MWTVVGYKIKESGEKKYCDLYLERDSDGVTGKVTFNGNYSMNKIRYVPELGDIIVISTGSYNGRTYISDIFRM